MVNRIPFLVLLLCPLLISAQEKETEDSLKFKAKLSLTGFYQTGNVNTLIFRTRADAKWKPWNKLVFRSRNSYLYQEFGNEKADEDIVSLNFLEFNPEQRLFPLAIGIVSSNFRREIGVRYLLGGGLTYKVFENHEDWLKISISWEYENTNFTDNQFNYEEYEGLRSINTVRNTIWLSSKKKIFNEKLHLGAEAYFQPSLEDGNNFRWQVDLSTELPITKRINFKINYLHTYERIVVQDNDQEDIVLTFGFSWKSHD